MEQQAVTKSAQKIRFNYGQYFVGDPCYAIQNVDYDLWINFLDAMSSATNGHFTFKGHKVWAHRTKHGDGTFRDKENNAMFEVDSSLISIIPMSLLDEIHAEYGKPKNIYQWLFVSNNIFEISQFEPQYNDGVFKIGHLTINTKKY
jgi:hypothetical protein